MPVGIESAESVLADAAAGGIAPMTAFVSAFIQAWPAHRPFSTKQILAEHPEWSAHPSLIIDLAGEEYGRRVRQGEAVLADDFVRQFPGLEAEVWKLIRVCQPQLPPSRPREPLWPEPDEVLANYRMLELLGFGDRSRVFLAEDRSLDDRPVVLKFVPWGSTEAQLMARTEHPHVMPVQHVIPLETRGLTAICMPYLGRATLAHVTHALRKQPVRQRTIRALIETLIANHCLDGNTPAVQRLQRSRAHALEFVVQTGVALAEACAAAHDRGVMHRDIKPSNVLLTFEGVPLLLDFNLARAAGEWAREGGTLPYMPPERLTWAIENNVFAKPEECAESRPATPHPPDAPAGDVFSLAATLFEVLSGEPPFGCPGPSPNNEALARAMLALQASGPSKLAKRNSCVNRSLARLLERGLQLDPQLRPQSMHEFAAALRSELRWRPRLARRWRWQPQRLAAETAAGIAIAAALIPLGDWAQDRWEARASVIAAAAPTDAAGLTAAGLAALNAGHPTEALGHLQQALKLEPTGYRAALAATAALRDNSFPARTKSFLEQADELGYSSLEHQNNWAVYELRFGMPSAACARLTPLLDGASSKVLPIMLLNWMEADLQRTSKDGGDPDLRTMGTSVARCDPTPWHHFWIARLFAASLKSGDPPDEVLNDLMSSVSKAVASGIGKDWLAIIERDAPEVSRDPRWKAILKTARAKTTLSTQEVSLIPHPDISPVR